MQTIFNFFSEILDIHDLKSERIFVQTKALLWTRLSGKPSWKDQNYAVHLLNIKQRNLLSKAKKSSFRNLHIKKKSVITENSGERLNIYFQADLWIKKSLTWWKMKTQQEMLDIWIIAVRDIIHACICNLKSMSNNDVQRSHLSK